MAVAAELTNQGVPIRDAVVVVRDFENYEEPLSRAAIQYGLSPVFWRQLHVTRTRPYGLIQAICDLLDADEPSREVFLRPLYHRWSPTNGELGDWPIPPKTIDRAGSELPLQEQELTAWVDLCQNQAEIDDRVEMFVEWAANAPDLSPDAITEVLGTVVDGYAEYGVPATKQGDDPALLATETEARAVVRLQTLVQQLRHKFEDRLEEGSVEPTWEAVGELADVIATQRPGRREHSNARALDVMEANDVWELDVPVVILVGLTDAEWPRETDSALPAEFEEAVLTGSGEAENLAPRPAWTDGRDRDQLLDTLSAAERGVVAIRHTRTFEGDDVRPSPFLEHIECDFVPESGVDALLGPDRELPAELSHLVTTEADSND
ncbi:hypothetical protein [Natronoglomus mannanivorans]|uniref:ATP-dependent helicase/nuclease subunit B n=1 Tax=Natronoglomus mannanivorans TaxID=2979990 RepID=A0AAP3E4U0_9EURY|nr:hypothetical protein [Halobacteria archaeon AArc-xg1-1]